MNATKQEPFVPLLTAAQTLGVPAAWLRAQAQAGQVPVLKTGRRYLFSLPLVERVLLQRAEQSREGSIGDR
jgi:hypothetical protein